MTNLHLPTSAPGTSTHRRSEWAGFATSPRRLSGVLLTALALLAGACGGDDDTAGDAPAAEATGSAGDAEIGASSSDDTETGASPSDGVADDGSPKVGFDSTVLPTTPVAAADLRVYDPNGGNVTRLPSVDAVVNTCDVLSAADVSAVATQLSAEESFGEEVVFTDGELLTSRCSFQSDTHGVAVIVGSADQVNADQPGAVLPVASGDVTGTAWNDDAGVTILSEDSFGLDTPFAAHVQADEYGIVVYNRSGTGIDFGSNGELFARLAAIAAEQVGQAGPPQPIDETANIQTARPCDYWSFDDLQAFLDPKLADIAEPPNSDQAVCTFGDFDGYSVQVQVEHISGFDPSAYDPSPNSDAVFSYFNGKAFFVAGDSVVEVRIDTPFLEENGFSGYPNSEDAAAALAENLASRYQG